MAEEVDLERNENMIKALFKKEEESLCVKSLNWVMRNFSFVIFLLFFLYVVLAMVWINHMWVGEGHSWDVEVIERLGSEGVVDLAIYMIVGLLFVGIMTFLSAFLIMLLTGEGGYVRRHMRNTFLKAVGLDDNESQRLVEGDNLEAVYRLMSILDHNHYVEEMSGRIVTRAGKVVKLFQDSMREDLAWKAKENKQITNQDILFWLDLAIDTNRRGYCLIEKENF